MNYCNHLFLMLCFFFEVYCCSNILDLELSGYTSTHIDAHTKIHIHTLARTGTHTPARARTHTQTHTYHVHALYPLLLLLEQTHTLTQTLTHTHAHAGFSQRARSLLLRSLRCCCSCHTFSPCQLKKELLLALTTGAFFPPYHVKVPGFLSVSQCPSL
jgi:hypothetical protein